MKGLAVGIALLIVAALTWAIWPYVIPGASRSGAASSVGTSPSSPASSTTSSSSGGVLEAPRPETPLQAPLSAEERRREELGQKRLPYYRFLRQHFSDAIERFAVTEALDTLDLVIARDDEETLSGLVQNAVAPSAYQYGFRKVRFYVRNPIGSVEPFRLIAETTRDESGRWNTFRK